LASFRQGRLDLLQWRTATGGDDQLLGFVADDASMASSREWITQGSPAQEAFALASLDIQLPAIRSRR
jgi:hypothetical protein